MEQQVVFGKVAFTPKGEWQSKEKYERYDMTYKGACIYISLKDENKAALDDETAWLDYFNVRVTTDMITDEAITNEKLKDGLISWAKLDDNVKNIIASREEGGIALANELGNSKMIGISQWKLTEEITDIKGQVGSIADEEDLTVVKKAGLTKQVELKLKDKAYDPDGHSGMGRKYLRKNNVVVGGIPFMGIVENVNAAEGDEEEIIDEVFFDRVRERFVGAIVSLDPTTQAKSYSFLMQWEDYGSMAYSLYVPISSSRMYDLNGVPYKWSGSDLVVYDGADRGEKVKNVLTQAMLQDADGHNQENTIFHIQYDYTLDGESIEVPAGSILLFEGGSISNGTLTGDFTVVKAIGTEVFNNVTLPGNVESIDKEVADLKAMDNDLSGRITEEANRAMGSETNLQQGIGALDSRLQQVEGLAELSVEGGQIGIASATDFTDRTAEGDLKIPTVGAILNAADEEPTVGSDNLVKSGGVNNAIKEVDKKGFLNQRINTLGYVNTQGDYTGEIAPSSTIASVFIPVKEGDVIKIYGKASNSTYYKFYALYSGLTQETYGKFVKVSVYNGANTEYRINPFVLKIPNGIDHIAVNLPDFDENTDYVLLCSDVDINSIKQQIDHVETISTNNNNKLIKLSKWGSAFTLEEGQYGYKTSTKELRYYERKKWDGSSIIVTIPFLDGAIYQYNNKLYIWDSQSNDMISFDKLVIDDLKSKSVNDSLSANQGRVLYEDNFVEEPNKSGYIDSRQQTDGHRNASNTINSSLFAVEQGDIVRIYGKTSTSAYYKFYVLSNFVDGDSPYYNRISYYDGAANVLYRDEPFELTIPSGVTHMIVNFLDYDATTDKVIISRKSEIKVSPDIPKNSYGKYYASTEKDIYYKTYEELISAYDTLTEQFQSFITKNQIGTVVVDDETSFGIYEYVISNGNYNKAGARGTRDSEIVKPIVGIITGIHGNERSSVNGLYFIIRDMLLHSNALSPLLNTLELHIIPVACPWGFQNNSRVNHNGVNINRNFASNGWSERGQGTNDYSGPSAASEQETIIIQDWMLQMKSKGTKLIMDWHNSGFTKEISCFVTASSNLDVSHIKKNYLYTSCSLAGLLVKNYKTQTDCIWGYTAIDNTQGMSSKYMADQGIVGCYFETTNKVYSPFIYQISDANVGATVVGNTLIELANMFNIEIIDIL